MSGSIAVLIPARLGSTRMPEKMLRSETGRPLITHTVDAAEAAVRASGGRISTVVVATDDVSIEKAVNEYAASAGYGTRAQMTRADHKSGTDRIAEVAEALPGDIDTLINIQGDEPDLPPEVIITAADILERYPQAAMSTLVREIHSSDLFADTNAVKAVMDGNGRCLYFSRSPIPCDRDRSLQPGEPYGYLHLGIYGYRRDILLGYSALPPFQLEELEKLEQLRALGAGLDIYAAVTEYDGVGIDTEADYAEFVRRQGSVNHRVFKV